MWILLAIASAMCLGVYDIFKKLSLTSNNVLTVLFLNTLFGTLLLSPIIIGSIVEGTWGFGTACNHLYILGKSLIVLSSWILGYFAVKHLPLTITGPINSTRPIMVLVGAWVIFGERLNVLQWTGILLGFTSLFFISRIGHKEGFSLKSSLWLWLMMGATIMGAVSSLYDKFIIHNLHFQPLQVQAWYSFYQMLIMGLTVALLKRKQLDPAKFEWRWTIPLISLFLTVADIAYFYALSIPGAMISVISMIRRGSVIVSFLYGIVILKEPDKRMKTLDLVFLIISLVLLVVGSNMGK